MGDGKPVNYKDIFVKVFWTAVAAALTAVAIAVPDIPVWWAPLIIAPINAGLAWVRQRVGATPPEAPVTV
jgi:hypothetical protein